MRRAAIKAFYNGGWMDGWSERGSERSGECRERNGAPNFPSIFREITMASLSLSLSSPSAVLSRTKYPFYTLKDISSIVY